MAEPRTTYLEDEYHFAWDAVDVEIIVERVREERGALRGDFSPQSISGNGYLPSQTLDLISAESAKRYSNVLGSRMLDGDAWFTMVTQAQALTRVRYRSGEPSVELHTLEWRGRPRFLVAPFVEDAGTAILFGDGGVSKSIHALALALSVASGVALVPGTTVARCGPVLYLDWETEAQTQAERLEALCAGADIDRPEGMIYMRRTGSLGASVREIRREIARRQAVMVVVDSVGAACGGDPERAEAIIRAFDGMRALTVPVLAIHHIPKDAHDRSKPFGSVYAPNLARLLWRLDRQQEAGEGAIYVTATNTKANNGQLAEPQGHRLAFDTDTDGRLAEVRFEQVGRGYLPPSGKGNGVRNTIAAALRPGPLLVAEIAMETQASAETVRRTMNRYKDWFVRGADGRWGLLYERDTVPGQGGTGVRDNGTKAPPPIGGLVPAGEEKEREPEGRFMAPPGEDEDANPF